ncbi:MAG TPA: bifunctional diaminohydroxyphosphoribosylaminopyrimidine deaminase/5-amino-6-(5-phosphoribosylamino)uracil reductase RibD [Gemmatimonadales bacterium]
MTEQEAMLRALALAEQGWGRVAPNPLVGTVLLRDGEVIGAGFHAEFGGVHAEAAALAACDDPAGATCVVNLEPCAHQGKTPPCVSALIAAGVRRVVAALPDPNPTARGGAAVLRGAGVEVEFGTGAQEAAALNAPFLWTLRRPGRPFVALKVATSLDGFLADAHGRSQWISGAEARDFAHWLRAGFDAIAVGHETAVRDDPELTVRGSVTPRVPPWRVVFARRRVEPGLKMFGDEGAGRTVVLVAPEARDPTETVLAGTGVRVIAADGLQAGVEALGSLGIRSLLVEGGGRLATAFLAAGLADRVYWVQAPVWLGAGVPAFGSRDPVTLDGARAWSVVERRGLGRDSLLVVDRELCLPAS